MLNVQIDIYLTASHSQVAFDHAYVKTIVGSGAYSILKVESKLFSSPIADSKQEKMKYIRRQLDMR